MKEYSMAELAKMSQQELINIGLNPDGITDATRLLVPMYLDFQKALEQMAFEDPCKYVRIEATKRIMDEDVLLKIALTADVTSSLIATKGIEDQKKLRRILDNVGPFYELRRNANNCSKLDVCESVLRKIDVSSNQILFEKIALADSIIPDLRWTAICRLTNKNLLLKLKTICNVPIIDSNSVYIQGLMSAAEQTLNRLERKAFLKAKYGDKLFEIKYGLTDSNILRELRFEEVCKLTNQNTLEMIALNFDEYDDIKCKAISKINNQKVLIQIALNSEEFWKVRFESIRKIADQKVLTQVALNDKTTWIERFEAVRKITDQNVLTQIALHDADYNVKIEAICRLTNKSVLNQIVTNDEEVIREGAKQRLKQLK